MLWGKVGREDAIIAGKNPVFFILSYLEAGPSFVRVFIFGADCFVRTGHISCILPTGFLERWVE